MRDRSKITHLIHFPGNISDELKVLNDFGTKYAKGGPFKECRHQPTTKNNFGEQQEVNDTAQKAVDYIILQETEE